MRKAFDAILLIHIMAMSSLVFGASDFPIEVKDGRSPTECAPQLKYYGRSLRAGLAEEGWRQRHGLRQFPGRRVGELVSTRSQPGVVRPRFSPLYRPNGPGVYAVVRQGDRRS